MSISGYDKSEDGKENRLIHWLRVFNWSIEDAALILLNINPETVIYNEYEDNFSSYETFTGKQFVNINSGEFRLQFDNEYTGIDEDLSGNQIIMNKVKDYKLYFGGSARIDFYISPQQWIEAALFKSIDIPWLQFAKDNGFYKPNAVNKNLVSVDKPLSNKERNTFLVIIAALAKEAKLDIKTTSKTADLIAKITQNLGAPIGATTIENKLKEITQALESRAK